MARGVELIKRTATNLADMPINDDLQTVYYRLDARVGRMRQSADVKKELLERIGASRMMSGELRRRQTESTKH